MPREPLDVLLRRLHWTVLRPIASRIGGDERSRMLGAGMELNTLREYVPGDDVRRIDWNVTARVDRPFIREAHAERALDVWLLVDLSASIDWGTAECIKRDRALELSAVAGQLLGRHGNRVGALLFADRPLGMLPPNAGRDGLLRLLGQVRDEPRQQARGATDLAAAVERAGAVIRRRSMVVIVSDFLAPDGWLEPLRRLAARHEVVAVVLRDPRESEIPDVGLITFEDPETGEQLVVDTSAARFRQRFRDAAERQLRQLQDVLAGVRVDNLVVGTDESLLPPLMRFLETRRRRRRLRGGSRST
jgi:uncharacterized protein (DUF58 family)